MLNTRLPVKDVLARAEAALAQGLWAQARDLLTLAAASLPRVPQVHHQLASVQLALGQAQSAVQSASTALTLAPRQWQTQLVKGKALKALKQMEAADACFESAIHLAPDHGEAFVAKADLAMNVFGLPLQAIELVKPWLGHSAHGVDAELTTLMASLYDRDMSALELTQRVVRFSRQHMRLPNLHLPALPKRQIGSHRPRVGIISPLFCNSPVYFLTIAGWRHVAKGSDIVVFSRGHKADWATDEFRALAKEWVNVQMMPAAALAQRIHSEDLDVLYDLGGWMDPVALKALSAQPARAMYKWVGGQSMTTGLDNFDGWIGDEWQSPAELKHLYTEPIVNIAGGYATYTPPPYLPKGIPWHKRRKEWVVFSNPAKLSRKFLAFLRKLEGRVCFVHRQFQYARTQEHVIQALNGSRVTPEFICPKSHLEALTLLGEFQQMIDTFPYSSGLTAREAQAMGLKVKIFSGELFCERHSLRLS